MHLDQIIQLILDIYLLFVDTGPVLLSLVLVILVVIFFKTRPDGTVAKLSGNGLAGTGSTSWYWLQSSAGL